MGAEYVQMSTDVHSVANQNSSTSLSVMWAYYTGWGIKFSHIMNE